MVRKYLIFIVFFCAVKVMAERVGLAQYYVQLFPIVIEIRIQDSVALGLRLAYVEKDSSRWRLAGHRERPPCESLAEKRERRLEALDVHGQRPAEPDANSSLISGAY